MIVASPAADLLSPALSPARFGPLRNGNKRGNPHLSPRCGARTRTGTPCRAPAISGCDRCRMHGGRSTGPRTADGLARMVAAKTTHGGYTEAARARLWHSNVLYQRTRLFVAAVELLDWLAPELRARLLADPLALATRASRCGVETGDTTSCTVSAARPVGRGRLPYRARARQEAAALAPWRAAARAVRRSGRGARHDP
jgi:hypothetical protein